MFAIHFSLFTFLQFNFAEHFLQNAFLQTTLEINFSK